MTRKKQGALYKLSILVELEANGPEYVTREEKFWVRIEELQGSEGLWSGSHIKAIQLHLKVVDNE
jgi:hypothetical protein